MSSPADFEDAPEEQQGDGLFSGMEFYVNCGADSGSENGQLGELIESRGGKVVDKLPEDDEERRKLFVVALYNDTRLRTVTPAYVRACCENGALLEIEKYLVPFDEFRSVIDTELQNEQQQERAESKEEAANGGVEEAEQPEEPHADGKSEQEKPDEQPLVEMVEQASPKVQETEESSDASSDQNYPSMRSVIRANLPAHNKASFTEAEDEFILEVVRKNPTRRTTHTLYDEISHYVPNHTGNSIRHRFRVYLSKRLEFVYATDKNGKLERDEHGNLIKTKHLPPSIKKKFTADEDYLLAIGIKKQFYRDLYQVDPETGKSLISEEDSPTAVAKRNMTMDPNHVPGTEPTFQDYRVGDRRGPIAREFFKTFGENNPTHTENAWRDRFRKFLLSYGIDSYVEYYEAAKQQGQVPEPMKNLTNRVKRPGIPTPGNYNSAAKRARTASSEKESPSGSVAPSTAAAAIAAASGNGGNNLETGAAHYAISETELLDEDTMNFISSLKNDLSKIDGSIPFEYPQEIAEAIRNDFSNEEAIYDNVDPDTIPFPPSIASTDLFLPQFFRMSSTREFLEKLQEVISRDYEPSQAEKLVQDLCDETGVRKTFSTSILTALSGDLMVFPRYFLNIFKSNSNPPMDVPGIWTREDDRMLRSNKEEDIRALIKKHGSGRMEMRKKFVEKDLI